MNACTEFIHCAKLVDAFLCYLISRVGTSANTARDVHPPNEDKMFAQFHLCCNVSKKNMIILVLGIIYLPSRNTEIPTPGN